MKNPRRMCEPIPPRTPESSSGVPTMGATPPPLSCVTVTAQRATCKKCGKMFAKKQANRWHCLECNPVRKQFSAKVCVHPECEEKFTPTTPHQKHCDLHKRSACYTKKLCTDVVECQGCGNKFVKEAPGRVKCILCSHVISNPRMSVVGCKRPGCNVLFVPDSQQSKHCVLHKSPTDPSPCLAPAFEGFLVDSKTLVDIDAFTPRR